MSIQVRGRIYIDSLEFFAVDRCNLRCQHCAANSPYLTEANHPDSSQFEATLKALEPVLRAYQVKILGGEPLLNPDLISLMRIARDSAVFRQIRVTTNGTLLPRMDTSFWELADVVEISVYPSTRAAIERVRAVLCERAAQYGTVLEIRSIDTFQRAISEAPLDDSLVERVFRACGEAHAWSCHTLYRGRIYRCSRVHTLDRFLALRGIAHPPFTHLDGLTISDRPSLLDELRAYLSSPKPLRACTFCLGTSGVFEPHRQLSGVQLEDDRNRDPVPFSPSWITLAD